jgi:outer membrane receptor for ferrienterochelin and colicins
MSDPKWAFFQNNNNMRILLILCCLMFSRTCLYAQQTAILSGRVLDKDTREGLAYATVSLVGISANTVTDQHGFFRFSSLRPGIITTRVSHVGYETQETSTELIADAEKQVSVQLASNAPVGGTIVISATKRPEKFTFAPATIHLITAKDISRFAGSNVGELFSAIQGVEYTRSGVDEITVNARGLNSVFNVKVFQLIDGRNSMSPASAGLALFNNGTVQKDDIAQTEIVLGPQSALYGPNAHNALFNVVTKDPRKYQGTTVSMSVGNQSQFSGRLRFAKMINRAWAYKLSGEMATGEDFTWFDTVYAGNQPPTVWTGDPERPPAGTTPYFGPPVSIPERVPDFNFRRYRGEAHLYYSPKANTDLILSAGGSNFTRLQLTTSGRNQLTASRYGFAQGRFVRPGFFANVYYSWIDLGSVLNIYNYTRDFWNSTHDVRKPLPPDSAELWARRPGNVVTEKSGRLNMEFQYNHNFEKAGLHLVAGATMQLDRPNGFGLTLIDSFQRIQVLQLGSVIQLDKKLPWSMRFVGTARVDYHNYLGTYVTPRLALLKHWENSQLRFTWGRALTMPTIQQQFAAINRTLYGNGGGIRYIPANYYVGDTVQTIRLKPEMVNTWEIGYKGTVARNWYVDVNAYYGTSINFISPPRVVAGRATQVDDVRVYPANSGTVLRDTLRGGSFLTYFNYGTIQTYGLDFGVDYRFSRHLSGAVRYSWIGSDIGKQKPGNDANKDGFTSVEEGSLNAPRHRGVIVLKLDDLFQNKWRFSFTTRFVEQYDFYSGNQIGTAAGQGSRGIVYGGKAANGLDRWYAKNFDRGPLGGFTTVDVAAGYLASKHVTVNLGITNLFNTRQIEALGSPSIGRLVVVELKVHLDPNE